MSLIKSIIGRRQFLIATGVATTCAFACKKLAGFETRVAMAAESAAAANIKAAGNRCPHLLSPLRIRNRVLKNRIMHTVSPTYFMQGPENYPTEMYRNHYSNMAKNAAIVSVSTHFESSAAQPYPKASEITVDDAFNHYSDRSWSDNTLVYNYVNEMIDDIHYQGAMILFAGNTGNPGGTPGGGMPGGDQDGPENMPEGMPQGGAPGGQGQMPPQGGMPSGTGGGVPPEMASKTDDEILAEAKEHEKKGYDVYEINLTNLEAAKKVRAATNLILMGRIRGAGRGMPVPGNNATDPNSQPTAEELKQAVEQAKQLEGLVDILWIRVDEHPSGWTQEKG